MASRRDRRTATSSWFDKLTMRVKPLISRGLILSLSKDGAMDSCFFNDRLKRTELEGVCASL
jgi:hypothetical protein